MIDYHALTKKAGIKTLPELREYFFDEIAQEWSNEYAALNEKRGLTTLQNFQGFAFLMDDGNQLRDTDREADTREILECRTLGAFGISGRDIKAENRRRMKSWIGNTTSIFETYGPNYDKGHFIAHGFGGPVDINLFPQRRDINRGWSTEGKIYRDMEKFVAANPGTFVFSRAIYRGTSFCPSEIEYGYCQADLKFHVREFPNLNDGF